jgi:hypothetical protein
MDRLATERRERAQRCQHNFCRSMPPSCACDRATRRAENGDIPALPVSPLPSVHGVPFRIDVVDKATGRGIPMFRAAAANSWAQSEATRAAVPGAALLDVRP